MNVDEAFSLIGHAIESGRAAHGYLVCGDLRGQCDVLADKVLRALFPDEPGQIEGKCHPDVAWLEPEGKSRTIHAESMRERIVEPMSTTAFSGGWKAGVVVGADRMEAVAANAFLKTLEEPPAYAKFIMATTEKHKIIPTILSRCQVYDFKRINEKDIVRHLQYVAQHEGVSAEEEALHVVAEKADGALRDALSIFDQLVSFTGKQITYKATIENLNVLDVDNYFKITDFLFNDDPSPALLLFDDILAKGFEAQHFIAGLAAHFRNLLMAKTPATVQLLETSDNIKGQLLQQSQKVDKQLLLRAMELANQCDFNYKMSNNKRLSVELCLLQINANYVYKKARQSQERK